MQIVFIFKQAWPVFDPVCAIVLGSVQLGVFICVAGQQEHQVGLNSCHTLLFWRGEGNKELELEVWRMHSELILMVGQPDFMLFLLHEPDTESK